jgi:hypothetical protein
MAPNPSSAPFTSTYSNDETTSTGDGLECPFFNIKSESSTNLIRIVTCQSQCFGYRVRKYFLGIRIRLGHFCGHWKNYVVKQGGSKSLNFITYLSLFLNIFESLISSKDPDPGSQLITDLGPEHWPIVIIRISRFEYTIIYRSESAADPFLFKADLQNDQIIFFFQTLINLLSDKIFFFVFTCAYR